MVFSLLVPVQLYTPHRAKLQSVWATRGSTLQTAFIHIAFVILTAFFILTASFTSVGT